MTHAIVGRPASRRNLLKGALLGASAAGLGAPFLAACGGTGPHGNGTAPGTGPVDLPAYQPAELVPPDLPGTPDGVQDGYLRFPDSLVRSVDQPPLSGGGMTSLVLTYDPPPPELSRNTYWQAVNERLGGELRPTIVPQADYQEKFTAVTAGGELPDTVLMTGGELNAPRLLRLLSSSFTDLSDRLAGDAVRDYPNLANIPTYAWRNARINGRIWGVPIEQQILTNVMMGRLDLVAEAGATPADVKTTDDFRDLCRDITNERAGRWAMGPFGPTMMLFFWPAFGVPNNWRLNPDGTLTKDWETEEYFAAFEYHLELSREGLFHPDFLGLQVTQAKQHFAAGTTAFYLDGLAAWQAYIDQEQRSLSEVGVMQPFALPGLEPAFNVSNGIFGVTVLRQDDPERIEERLRVLDFLAAPFGTEEWFLLNYGVEGETHERNDGLPVLTGRGQEEIKTMFKFIGAPPSVMFSGVSPDWVRAQHEWETEVVPTAVADPTVGVYIEPVEDTTGALQAVYDGVADTVAERISITEFREICQNWTEKVGNETRDRLQAALAEQPA